MLAVVQTTRGDPPLGSDSDRGDPGWPVLGRVIGGITGFAAVIYFVGAATMWLRLDLHGFNPEIGLAHMPSMQLAILGLRGVGLVAAVAAVPASGVLIWHQLWLRRWQSRAPQQRAVNPRWVKVALSIAVSPLILAGLYSWTWFGIALAAITSILALGWFEKTLVTETSPRWSVLAVGLGLAAAVAAVCIQVGAGEFQISGVRLDPAPNAASENLSLPYFGQADGYVYVPHVISSAPSPRGGRSFHDNGEIIAVTTAGRSIQFPAESDYMRYHARPPWKRGIALVRENGSSLWSYLQRHLG